jgi:hypothetical protein
MSPAYFVVEAGIMITEIANDGSYRVEASGWDISEEFFVERTVLTWDPEQGKKIRLRSQIDEGAILFVRLSHPLQTLNNFPVAYQVERIGRPDGRGSCEISLVRLRPKRHLHGPEEDSSPADEATVLSN